MICSCKPKIAELESKVAALEYAFIMVTGRTPRPVKPMSVPGDAVGLSPLPVGWSYLEDTRRRDSASEEDWQVSRSCCQK